ncbi:MAG: M20 family metallopeptidase [Clostridiales bacterium]|nr:M20 family metallopeptidase [Clostridiales bacterium]
MIFENQNFVKDLAYLISCKSVKSTNENAPFGEENKKALLYFLELAKKFGFETINYDNYFGEVIVGSGEEFGIIGHLDVVPEGTGWDTDPYTLTVKDGKAFGRGIADDKAPILSCLYALKELKDKGFTFNKKIRLFVGCNEESGWKDVEYFKTKSKFPDYGFSPDGDFPVVFSEKGINRIYFSIPKLKNYTFNKSGTVINAVCAYASMTAKGEVNKDLIKKHGLKLNGNLIESFGKTAHGSKPELGKNAIKPLFDYLLDAKEDVKNIVDYIFNDKLGLSKIGDDTGFTTLSANLIEEREDDILISVDFRIPATKVLEDFIPLIEKFGIKFDAVLSRKPLFVPKTEKIVQDLVRAYNEVLGVNENPIPQSGGTFASVFKRGCAFGPEFPNKNNQIHEPNEFMEIEDINKMYEIYLKAIENIVK